jgi:hypothetical protein
MHARLTLRCCMDLAMSGVGIAELVEQVADLRCGVRLGMPVCVLRRDNRADQ